MLHDRGDIHRKEVGARSVVWWVADDPIDAVEIDPGDRFWSAAPVAAGGPTDLSENVDAYLYGSPDEK